MSVPQKGDLRPGELRVVLLAGLYSFFLFASYYPLRALRDAFGAEQPKELHWLFTGTLTVTLIVQPLYGWLVSKRGRAAFIPISYRFLILNAVAFGLLLDNLEGEALTWAQRAFFVWLSAYIQFAVTVFWGFLADLMGSPRARRLYGRIAIGGTLGAMSGSAFASLGPSQLEALAATVGLEGWARPSLLLPLLSALFLELAVRAARAVERAPLEREPEDPDTNEHVPVGGRALDGFRDVSRSRHLRGICLYVGLFVLGSTMLYYINSVVTKDAFATRDDRTAFFGRMDLLVNSVALVLQLFLTGKVLQRLGLGVALALVPAVGMLGFGAIALTPSLLAIAVVHVLRRSSEFGLSKPAREALFTVMTRDEKYKAKALIDTVVYRGGDAASMWLQAALTGLGVGLTALSVGMIPLCVLGVFLSVALGREHARRARAIAERSVAAEARPPGEDRSVGVVGAADAPRPS